MEGVVGSMFAGRQQRSKPSLPTYSGLPWLPLRRTGYFGQVTGDLVDLLIGKAGWPCSLQNCLRLGACCSSRCL